MIADRTKKVNSFSYKCCRRHIKVLQNIESCHSLLQKTEKGKLQKIKTKKGVFFRKDAGNVLQKERGCGIIKQKEKISENSVEEVLDFSLRLSRLKIGS